MSGHPFRGTCLDHGGSAQKDSGPAWQFDRSLQRGRPWKVLLLMILRSILKFGMVPFVFEEPLHTCKHRMNKYVESSR